MAGTREIKRRIRSVKSTKKITRAMQMISAAKMRKAQAATLASRSYSALAWQIVNSLAKAVDKKYHPLLKDENKNNKVGVIVVSTNRGFVGGFNTAILNQVSKYLKDLNLEGEVLAEFVVMGRKGRDAVLRMKQQIVAEYDKPDRVIGVEEIRPISKQIINDFLAGNYSKIIIAYTHFNSTISQKPIVKQILPFKQETTEELPHEANYSYEYLFEPDPNQVLDYLLPRIIESQVYQAVLESDASEHSSRMVTMKNATDAATDLIDELTLTYNQLRQANITRELAEITAGKIALE